MDTFSRAFTLETNVSAFVQELEQIDHKSALPVSEARCHQIKQAVPVFQELCMVIQRGWPSNRKAVPEWLYPYFDIRDELTIEDELVFKGHQLVVPASLRRELMAVTHASHIGVEACIRRARDCLYWPLMSKEMKEYIARCDVCMAHRNEQRRKAIQQHEFVGKPWSKVTADLCDLDKPTLSVISDYFSNYIEVAHVQSVTTRSIIKELKAVFARFSIPNTLVTNNGPQFASAEFAVFARTWEFDHVTSSPKYPHSNGKAENAVKTVKSIFKKYKESGRSEFLALLDWCNTPTEGIGTSPA